MLTWASRCAPRNARRTCAIPPWVVLGKSRAPTCHLKCFVFFFGIFFCFSFILFFVCFFCSCLVPFCFGFWWLSPFGKVLFFLFCKVGAPETAREQKSTRRMYLYPEKGTKAHSPRTPLCKTTPLWHLEPLRPKLSALGVKLWQPFGVPI